VPCNGIDACRKCALIRDSSTGVTPARLSRVVASAANRGLPTIGAVLQAANNRDWGTYDDDDDAENDKLRTFAGTLDGLDDFFEGIERLGSALLFDVDLRLASARTVRLPVEDQARSHQLGPAPGGGHCGVHGTAGPV
jgi:hypothetical protein